MGFIGPVMERSPCGAQQLRRSLAQLPPLGGRDPADWEALLEKVPLDQLPSEPPVASGGANGRLVAIFEVAPNLEHRSVLRQSEVPPYGEAETPDGGPLGAVSVLV